MSECPVCKGVDGCRPTGLYLGIIKTLSKKDWAEIHHFYKYVFLPFIHRIVYRSETPTQKD